MGMLPAERGTIHAWGDNSRGQLGLTNSEKRLTVSYPEEVKIGAKIVDIAAGLYHSIAMTGVVS